MTRKVIIRLMHIVAGTATNTEGDKLFIALNEQFEKGNKVKLSLHNSPPLSSSFLNSSLGELSDKYGYNKIKENLSLIHYRPSQAKRIKNYLNALNQCTH